MFDTRPLPSSFPSSLVADPAEKALEELSRDIVIALDGISSDEGAVSREER